MTLTMQEWSPAIEAAAKEIYERLRLTRKGPKWEKLRDVDVIDHYCIAARNAVFAFHNQAAKSVEVEWDPNYGRIK